MAFVLLPILANAIQNGLEIRAQIHLVLEGWEMKLMLVLAMGFVLDLIFACVRMDGLEIDVKFQFALEKVQHKAMFAIEEEIAHPLTLAIVESRLEDLDAKP